MEEDILKKYQKAGAIAAEVRKYAKTLLKEGALLLEIADKIEKKILQLGGRMAFPVNLSINEIAAHHVPSATETISLKRRDLVKVDIGVQIDGYIADTAFSCSIGESKENQALIEAAEAGLAAALKLATPGTTISQIGSAIAKAITARGFQPIRNLSGHSVDTYNLHAGLTIPNYNNRNLNKIEKDIVLAIEPFATSGEGLVIEGKESEVFKLEKVGVLRLGRDILNFISEEYKTLPFAKRWLINKFGALKTNLFLKEALSKGLIKEYKVLREKIGAKVAQAEHTIIVDEEPKIITKEK